MSDSRSQAPTARNELLEHLRDAELPNTYYHQDDGCGTPAIRPATPSEAAEMALDVVEAAGWSKPRTVNSLAELDALPHGTLIRDVVDRVGEIETAISGNRVVFWIGNECEDDLEDITLPVTVLFTPGDAG